MKDPVELLKEFGENTKMIALVDSLIGDYFPKPRFYKLLKLFSFFITLPPTQREQINAFCEKHNLIYWSVYDYHNKRAHYFRQRKL